MTGMTGVYQHSLDAKGRLFIPAKLREDLGDVFYVTISITKEKCLHAYPNDVWQAMLGRVNAMPFLQQQRLRPFFASANRCELDTQGRVLFPQKLRDYAELTKNVTVIGNNNHVEFWDSDNWEPVYASEMEAENFAAVVMELGF